MTIAGLAVIRESEHFTLVRMEGKIKALDLCEQLYEAGYEIVLYVSAYHVSAVPELVLQKLGARP